MAADVRMGRTFVYTKPKAKQKLVLYKSIGFQKVK